MGGKIANFPHLSHDEFEAACSSFLQSEYELCCFGRETQIALQHHKNHIAYNDAFECALSIRAQKQLGISDGSSERGRLDANTDELEEINDPVRTTGSSLANAHVS